jgi:DNA adenine methylase
LPLVTRKVKGGEYLYFRELDPETKERREEYLGRKGESEVETKARLKEREEVVRQMNSLQLRLTEIEASLGPIDPDAKVECHPFVKWAGGKTQLIDKMKKYFPSEFKRYREPFLGGGAIFFYLVSTRSAFPATLSDSNRDLINAYQVIRKSVEKLIRDLTERQIEFRSKPNKDKKNELFLEVRANPPDIDAEPVSRANWFIFLNKTAYNGLYRVNSRGEFNVPYGDYKSVSFFEAENLRAISRVLNRRGIEIVWADYEEALKGAETGDWCYLDPPYFSADNKGFTAYNANLFTPEDQKKLADEFKRLTAKGVKVLLSNSKSDFVEKEFKAREAKGRPITYDMVEALRVINCHGQSRTGAKELLIKNY